MYIYNADIERNAGEIVVGIARHRTGGTDLNERTRARHYASLETPRAKRSKYINNNNEVVNNECKRERERGLTLGLGYTLVLVA